MPLPKPSEGQSQDDFVSECMSWMHDNESKRPRDQQLAMCFSQYREHHNKTKQDIFLRLTQLKDKLVEVFGLVGLKYFQYTLSRMGVAETQKGEFDYHGKLEWLPFVKQDGEKIEFVNVPLAEMQFEKIDKANRTVEGYASVFVADCDNDLIPPEAYSKSVEEYTRDFPVVYFAHQHREPPFGTIANWKIDDIGWWVKTKVAKSPSLYWEMVEDERLNGYSIGGRFIVVPEIHGDVRLWKIDSVYIMDLSAVPRPCNKLCFWDLFKKNDRNFEATFTGVTLNNSELPQVHSVITCSGSPTAAATCTKNWQKTTPTTKEKKEKMQEFDENGFAKDLTTSQRETLSESDFACPAQRKLPIHDAEHTRNAMARFNQTEGCQTAEVKARICRAAKRFGIESDWCDSSKSQTQKGGNQNLSENETETSSQEPQKQQTEPTDDDLIKMLEDRIEKRKNLELKKKVTAEEEKIKKLQEEDRIGTLLTKMGDLEVKLDKVMQWEPKIQDIDTRMTKMEELPARTLGKPEHEETLEEKAMETYYEAGAGEQGMAALNRMRTRMEANKA